MRRKLDKFGVTVHGIELKNGVRVFLFQRKGMPIYLRSTFFAGSRFDPIQGTAHFLEHMLLAGTEKFPSKNLIAEYLQRIGGDFGASTNNDILRFNVEIPEASDLDKGCEVLNEMFNKSLFDLKTIENERGAILSEFYNKKSNPKEYIHEVLRRLSLQGSPAGNSTLGNPESINSINRETLLNYKNHSLTSGRVVFLASGDIEIESLRNALENLALPLSNRFKVSEPLPILKDKMIDIEKYPGVEELQVSIFCRTSLESYREYCALKVLSSLLGEGRGSRLITMLRYKHGLVYSIFSNTLDSVDWGIFNIRFSCNKNNLEKVKDLIFQEFTNLLETGFSDQELLDTKAKIIKGFVRHSQTSDSWVSFHELQALFYPDDFKTADDYINTIDSLTNDDLRQVINKCLKKENFFISICGDY